MGKDKDRRMVLRRAAIGAAFVIPLVVAGCGAGGGDIPTKCLKQPKLCLPDFPGDTK